MKKEIKKLEEEIIRLDKIRKQTYSGKLHTHFTGEIARHQSKLIKLGGKNPLND